MGKFAWEPFLRGNQKPPKTVAEWVNRYETKHWEQTLRNPTKENTYHKNYRLVFNRLPQNKPLTIELLRSTILTETQPGSRSRKRFATAFRRLADFSGLDPNVLKELSKLGKGYTSKSVEPRSLPRDEDMANDQAPIGCVAMGNPAEAIAVVKAGCFDMREGGRQFRCWREVQVARVECILEGPMDNLKLARSLVWKGLSHREGNSWVLAKVSLAAKQG
jgi:hypothetical protein